MAWTQGGVGVGSGSGARDGLQAPPTPSGPSLTPHPTPTPSTASSWTRAPPTRPCSSTSGRRTRRTTRASWASTAPATCAVRVPPARGAPRPGRPLTVGPRASPASASAPEQPDPSAWRSRRELQEPPQEAGSRASGGCGHCRSRKEPGESSEGLGPARPKRGLDTPDGQEGLGGAGGHPRGHPAGPPEARPSGQCPGLCPAPVHTPTARRHLRDSGWDAGAPLSVNVFVLKLPPGVGAPAPLLAPLKADHQAGAQLTASLQVGASPATQTTPRAPARVSLSAWTRRCGTCPGRGTRARPSTWEPRRACACSSEYAHPCPSWPWGPTAAWAQGGPRCPRRQPWAGALWAGTMAPRVPATREDAAQRPPCTTV